MINLKNKFNLAIYLGAGSLILYLADLKDKKNNLPNEKITLSINKNEFNSDFPLIQVFSAEKYILREPLRNNFHISIPFNRKIKYIYNLDNFYYMDYENYNFNKLSDLFLNIHIFIN